MANIFASSAEANSDFSTQHHKAASFFADCAARIEAELPGSPPFGHVIYGQHQAYVSGSVLCSVAFLEAYINELFHHCGEAYGDVVVETLQKAERERLGRVWKRRSVSTTLRHLSREITEQRVVARGDPPPLQGWAG